MTLVAENFVDYEVRTNEAVINEVSNIIWNCFGLASLSSITGLKNSGHLFNQSDARPKPLAND